MTYLVLEGPQQRHGSPICSLPCLATWTRTVRQPVILGSLAATSRSCTHCVICAVAVHRPTDCLLHESCPSYRWPATLTARPIIAALWQLSGRRPVTDIQLRLAAELAQLCPELLPGEIAQQVLRHPAARTVPSTGRG